MQINSALDKNPLGEACYPSFSSVCEKIGDLSFAVASIALPSILGALVGFAIAPPLGAVGAILGALPGVVGLAVLIYRYIKNRNVTLMVSGEVLSVPAEVRAFLSQKSQDCKVKDAYAAVAKTLNGKKTIAVGAAYENHALHQHVTVITDKVKEEPGLKKVWEVFLRTKRTVVYPDNRELTLDFTPEIQRLQGNAPAIACSVIPKEGPWGKKDMQDVKKIIEESFTQVEISGVKISPQGVTICNRGPLSCLAVRDTKNHKILGMLFYRREIKNEEEVCHIYCVGRKAGAARLGVGELLFQELLGREPDVKMILNVRSRNAAARALYEKNGFLPVPVENPSEYSHPTDLCLLLQRDRAFSRAENTGS